MNSQGVTVARNAVHDIADDGIEIFDASGLMIDGNLIYRLIGKGTDGTIPGPCFNGHSDGIEITRVSNSTFDGNLIFDVRSNAAIFLSSDESGPAQYCRALVFADNVFVTPEASFTMYVFQTAGLSIRNNVIWKGLYGGFAVGDGVTDMDVVNDVLESINYSPLRPPYVSTEHRYSHNRVADVANWNQTPAIFGDERGNTIGEPGTRRGPAARGIRDSERLETTGERSAPFHARGFHTRTGQLPRRPRRRRRCTATRRGRRAATTRCGIRHRRGQRAPEPAAALLGATAGTLLAVLAPGGVRDLDAACGADRRERFPERTLASALAKILPGGVVVAVGRIGEVAFDVREEERTSRGPASRHGGASSSRVAASHDGRCRRSDAATPPLPDASGAPRWPAGVTGSVSHSGSLCVVVVATRERVRGVGVDVEPAEPLERELWPEICTGGERSWLEAQSESERDRGRAGSSAPRRPSTRCRVP